MNAIVSKQNGRPKKNIDMDYVIKEIEKGRTIMSLAEEYRVSRTTIYNHYKKYHIQKENMEEKEEHTSVYPELGDNPFE